MKKISKLLSLFAIPLLLSGCSTTQNGTPGEKGDKGDKGDPGTSTFDSQGLMYYPQNDGTYYVGAGSSIYLSNVTIPSTFNGKTVSGIADYGFVPMMEGDIRKYKNIILPDTIEYIGEYAFSYCEQLETINMPSNATYLGEMAFSGCQKLESLTIPEGITSVDSSLFEGCISLETVTLPSSIETINVNLSEEMIIPPSIIYNGTKSQWENIYNDDLFYRNEINVTCSDGKYTFEDDVVFIRTGTILDDANKSYFAYVWNDAETQKMFVPLTLTANNRRAKFTLPSFVQNFLCVECYKGTTNPDWEKTGDEEGRIYKKSDDVDLDNIEHYASLDINISNP